MGLLKKILTQVVVWSVSAVLSSLILTTMLIKRWWKGPEYFYVKPRPVPPPTITDPKWGKHAYMDLKSAGVKLHYVEKGDRSKPLMVFVHGFPECWFSWRHQITHFAQTHWVVALDLRGYGSSDKPASLSQYRRELLVEDVRLFIQALGREKCILVAHDWGAALAWILVSLYPDMFSAHVSCNGPHFNAFRQHLDSSFKQKMKSWYMFFFQMPWLPEKMLMTEDIKAFDDMFKFSKKADPVNEEAIEVYKYYFSSKDGFTSPINYYRNIDFGADDSVKLPRIKVPTLVVWGTEDVALDKAIAILSAAECDTAEVKFVEGAGHFVTQERPEEVNAHIQTFVQQLQDNN